MSNDIKLDKMIDAFEKWRKAGEKAADYRNESNKANEEAARTSQEVREALRVSGAEALLVGKDILIFFDEHDHMYVKKIERIMCLERSDRLVKLVEEGWLEGNE